MKEWLFVGTLFLTQKTIRVYIQGEPMQKQVLADLISFLEETSSRVLEIEKEADIALKQEGQLAFQAKLEEKAEILAALGEKCWKKTEAVGGTLKDEIARKLEQFSMSASTSLRIGSVFFMSALLYPEDHKPGEPNDLESFIIELKGKL